MQKKILIAVDNSRHSKYAIHYATHVSSFVKNMHSVLFHVQPMISTFLQQEARLDPKAKRQLNQVQKDNEKMANSLIETYRDEMVKMGIAPEQIEVETRMRKLGYAKDILEFGQKNSYDAIVVGRRGLSRIAEMYAGSVARDLVEQSKIIPVWLIDGKVPDGKIMAAVDGSNASLRVVDHISFLLSDNPEAELTLLHITSSARNYCEIDLEEQPNPELEEIIARGDEACVEQFYPQALKKLEEAGISEDRVKLEVVKGPRRVGNPILDFAKEGNYSTIVVGRRGIDRSFFMGSVSRHLFNKVSGSALWVVP